MRIQRLTVSIDAPRSPVIEVRRSAQLRPVPEQNVASSSARRVPPLAGPRSVVRRTTQPKVSSSSGVVDIVGGDVLEVAGGGVESEPSSGVDVSEPDRPGPHDHAADRRALRQFRGGK